MSGHATPGSCSGLARPANSRACSRDRRVHRLTQAGMAHRQHQPVERFCTPNPVPPVRLKGTLDRQFELSVPIVGEAQDMEVPGSPVSLHGLPSPLDDLLRGDNRVRADTPGARQDVPPGRCVVDPIRPLLANLLVAVAVAHQEQQATIDEQVVASLGKGARGVDAPTVRTRAHSRPRRVSSRAPGHGDAPA